MKSDLPVQLVVDALRFVTVPGCDRDDHSIVFVPTTANVERSSAAVELATSIADETAAFDLAKLNFGFP